ncbi:MAG: tRNA (cytosine(32)/uridine(32)-2'-O)-methyltransferase TrmJ, partial [Actinobacteria bacterium]|nr:tRNA (cytosine(32)/uridine(32)-2'-O)-methyltransferase TrmJ [Actinomycetota bacterium]
GLSRLCLVAPRDFPSEVATARAAGADAVLDAAEIHPSLEAAVAECTLVIGTTARSRTIGWPAARPGEAMRSV